MYNSKYNNKNFHYFKIITTIINKYNKYIILFCILYINFIFNIICIKNSKNIIVSLTSLPKRIKYVHLTIKSILKQTLKPNKIILWLAKTEFIKKKNKLPLNLLLLIEKGLTIKFIRKNFKSYNKLIPSLKKYPNNLIITIDDDIIYRKDTIEKLYKNYLKYPKDIHAHRITKFKYKSGKFKVIVGGYQYYKNSSFLNKLTGVGGVLYPPKCFYKDILKKELFMKLSPTNDDQWFWIQAILNNVRVRVIDKPNLKLNYIENTQNVGLSIKNDLGPKLFWKDFNRLLSYYPKLKQILIDEYNLYINNTKLKDNITL